MLLGKKSKTDAKWAVVLDRVPNEFIKIRSANALAQAFSISSEEAKDLMDNTPLILLDQLKEDVATKVKAYFERSDVTCSATSDTVAKRKCFRAMWPEEPDLHTMLGASEEVAASSSGDFETSQVNAPSKSLSTEVPTSSNVLPSRHDLGGVTEHKPSLSEEDQKRFEKMLEELQEENALLQSQIKTAEREERDTKRRLDEALQSQGDRFQTARSQLEEQLEQVRTENSVLVSKAEEAQKSLKARKLTWESAALEQAKIQEEELQAQLDHVRSEHDRAEAALKNIQAEWVEAENALSETRAELDQAKVQLNQSQAAQVQGETERERMRNELNEKLPTLASELEEWKRKAKDWSESYSRVIKENEFLRTAPNEELESLRARTRDLTAHLETARRQVREAANQLKQQEFIQKKVTAAQELSEHQVKLKVVVERQQALEDVLHEKEEELKRALSEQESIEREIVKSKQAHKFLLEQSKQQEKPRYGRKLNSGPAVAPPNA